MLIHCIFPSLLFPGNAIRHAVRGEGLKWETFLQKEMVHVLQECWSNDCIMLVPVLLAELSC